MLRARAFEQLDLDNIIEEIESLGREQASQIRSRLRRLLEHLLKLDASNDRGPRRGWRNSVREQRAQLLDRLEMSPSLRNKLPALHEAEWKRAVALAKDGLRKDEETAVDALRRYTIDQLLDENYFGERDATA
jgi:hypothetical protein